MSNFIWDENEINMVEPSAALFANGFPINTPPTSSNVNWLFNSFTSTRVMTGAYLDFGALLTPAPEGWLYCNGETLGSAASGAVNANDDYKGLFIHLWTYNAGVTVAPNKGTSALADWSANKTITLPLHDGTAMAMKSSVTGSALNVAPGTVVGAETVTLTDDNLPQIQPVLNDPEHSHPFSAVQEYTANNFGAGQYAIHTVTTNTEPSSTGITIDPFGGGVAHSNVQPSVIVYRLIKW